VANLEGRGLLALRVVGVLTALTLVLWTFHGVDRSRVADLVGHVGALTLLLVALPQFLSLSLECFGWRRVFAVWGRRVDQWSLLRVRLMTEAVAQTLPLGVIWSESLKPLLLARHAQVPASESVAAIVGRKYLLVSSQAVYVTALVAAGFGVLRHLSGALLGRPGYAWFAFGAGALLAILALGVGGAFARGQVAQRAFELLRRLPSQRVRAALQAQQHSFKKTDGFTEQYFAAPFLQSTLLPGVFFLCGWLCESLESFLILRLLGADLSFFSVAAIEVMLSFVRNVVFVIPAGLGVQDIGYVSCLTALGVPDALTLAAAFSLLKRGKELFWALIGYTLLAAEARLPQLRPEQLQPERA